MCRNKRATRIKSCSSSSICIRMEVIEWRPIRVSLLVACHDFDRLLSSIIDVESYDYRFRAGYTRARRKTLPLRSKTHELNSPRWKREKQRHETRPDVKHHLKRRGGSARKAGRRRCSRDVGGENEGEEWKWTGTRWDRNQEFRNLYKIPGDILRRIDFSFLVNTLQFFVLSFCEYM